MFKVQEIRELIKMVGNSNIDEFVYEHDGSKIKMKKNVAGEVKVVGQPVGQQAQPAIVQETPKPVISETQPAAKVVAAETVSEPAKVEEVEPSNLHKITSPMVGTFYESPSPDQDAYVRAGSKVREDSIVCIVEAMKLFNEIESEINGEIVEVLVKSGQLVEYGQPLFLVKPE